VLLKALEKNPHIDYIENNAVATASVVTLPWGLDRINQTKGGDGIYTCKETGAGVHVYVIDTGVDSTQHRASLSAALVMAITRFRPALKAHRRGVTVRVMVPMWPALLAAGSTVLPRASLFTVSVYSIVLEVAHTMISLKEWTG
jgi:hypothetical protein